MLKVFEVEKRGFWGEGDLELTLPERIYSLLF